MALGCISGRGAPLLLVFRVGAAAEAHRSLQDPDPAPAKPPLEICLGKLRPFKLTWNKNDSVR